MFKFLIQHKCSLMFHVFKFIALCVNLVVKFLRHILAISIIFNMSILLQIKASISLFSPDKGLLYGGQYSTGNIQVFNSVPAHEYSTTSYSTIDF